MRFDALWQIGDYVIHQTIWATWINQDEIEVMRWANGKFMERVNLTADKFATYRGLFAPYHSSMRYVARLADIPLSNRGLMA